MRSTKIALLIVITGMIAAFFIFDLGQYFNLEYLKARQSDIITYKNANEFQAAILYFIIYVVLISLPLPVGIILTLTGGALFGLLLGTLLVSFASTIGSTITFLASRFLFSEAIQTRFADKLKPINEGIKRDGALYLFTLRLVPVFPPFVINPVMGLTTMPVLTFFFVSQVGMLAGTIVYVNAGTQLAKIKQLDDIFSFELFISFALLGVFPLIAKKTADFIKARKAITSSD